MIYRVATKEDYKVLASIHQKAFNDFFLTSLGIEFLETFYKVCLKHALTIAICAIDDFGSITGFAIGSLKSKGYYKSILLNNFPQFVWRGTTILFRRPKSLIRLILNLEKQKSNSDDKNYSELLSICVLPERKGKGVGKHLLSQFELEVIRKSGKKIALTTDYFKNEQALQFYLQNGYRIFYEFTTYPSRKMYKLLKELT